MSVGREGLTLKPIGWLDKKGLRYNQMVGPGMRVVNGPPKSLCSNIEVRLGRFVRNIYSTIIGACNIVLVRIWYESIHPRKILLHTRILYP